MNESDLNLVMKCVEAEDNARGRAKCLTSAFQLRDVDEMAFLRTQQKQNFRLRAKRDTMGALFYLRMRNYEIICTCR